MDTIMNTKAYEMQFINLIRDRLGIIIHSHQIKELNKTILEGCDKFHCSPKEYLDILSICPSSSPQLEHLVLGITVGETYFFRDKRQMELLQNVVLPKLIQRKRESGNLSLRIWSAGCASGEEIYTIAMMLAELISDISKWSISLLGTDINTLVLKKALEGKYGEWSMRSITDYYKKHYFHQEGNKYYIDDKLKDWVSFSYLNLSDDTFPSIHNGTNAQDLILCRNVLIYFDTEHVTRLMQKITSSLVDGGYLLLGASDPIQIKETNLIFHYQEGLLFSRPLAKTENLIELEGFKERRKSPIVVPIKKSIVMKPQQTRKIIPIQLTEEAITKLLVNSQWQEILELFAIHKPTTSFFMNAKATALANMGMLEESLAVCQESIALNKTDKQSHFTQAMVQLELNLLDAAEDSLRKTLFLDRNFVMGHYQIGLLMIRKKDYEAGIKSLQNALKIVDSKIPTESVQGFSDLTYGRLADILKNEIDLHMASRDSS